MVGVCNQMQWVFYTAFDPVPQTCTLYIPNTSSGRTMVPLVPFFWVNWLLNLECSIIGKKTKVYVFSPYKCFLQTETYLYACLVDFFTNANRYQKWVKDASGAQKTLDTSHFTVYQKHSIQRSFNTSMIKNIYVALIKEFTNSLIKPSTVSL